VTRSVVLDIEGTVSPLSAVHDVLFPYARERLESWVRQDRPGAQAVVDGVRAMLGGHAGLDDVVRTLLEWQRRFEANIDRARELGGDERVRVWRIYLRVSRQGFESGFISVYQVRAVKPA